MAGRKFTDSQKEDYKRLVLDCICARLTTAESLEYIKTRSNGKIEISEDYFKHVKSSLKKDFEKQLEYLHKDRFAFIQSAFFDRVEEFKVQQRILHDIIKNNKNKPDVQIKAVHELHALTTDLANIHQALPGIMAFEIEDTSGILAAGNIKGNGRSGRDNLPLLTSQPNPDSPDYHPQAKF